VIRLSSFLQQYVCAMRAAASKKIEQHTGDGLMSLNKEKA
jgi:hypothetical protein